MCGPLLLEGCSGGLAVAAKLFRNYCDRPLVLLMQTVYIWLINCDLG